MRGLARRVTERYLRSSEANFRVLHDGDGVHVEMDGLRIGSVLIYNSRRALNAHLRKEDRFAPVTEDGNEWLSLEGRVGYIPSFEVPDALRGRGLGKKIAISLLREAKKAGVKTVVLHAHHPMKRETGPQQSFWSSVGFRTMRHDDGTYFGPLMGISL